MSQLAAYSELTALGVCPLPHSLFPPLLRLRQHSPDFPEEQKKACFAQAFSVGGESFLRTAAAA